MNKNEAKILIVDDIEDNRYTLERRLKKDGYTNIFLAEGGKVALEMATENKFDLILLDLMMPDMSGLEVLKYLKVILYKDLFLSLWLLLLMKWK